MQSPRRNSPTHFPTRALPFALALTLLLQLVSNHAASAQAASSPAPIPAKILNGARAEVARHTPYIMEYHVLDYPGGDVPAGTGVCTDLVTRALRAAGLDLQQAVHEDRVAHPEVYPTKLWDHKKPDRNIDHRRCPNLTVWFARHTRTLTTALAPASLKEWQGGDVVFFVLKGEKHPWHTAIVSDRRDKDGMPLIIEGYPPATSESRRLDAWAPIHSHYRVETIPPAAAPAPAKPQSAKPAAAPAAKPHARR